MPAEQKSSGAGRRRGRGKDREASRVNKLVSTWQPNFIPTAGKYDGLAHMFGIPETMSCTLLLHVLLLLRPEEPGEGT